VASDSGANIWASGAAYERYVGRWSRLVAREFVEWLAVPPRARWLDVGSGTGALAQEIVARASPVEVMGVDPSAAFVEHARNAVGLRFEVAAAEELPFDDASFDTVVSGLVLNFVADPDRAAREAARVSAGGGTVGAYVWDYAGEMQMIRLFWDTAAELDPAARELDEGRRFPICKEGPLADVLRGAELADIEVRAIDVPTYFRDFDDYWAPFLGGQGPAPAYAASLDDESLGELCERLRRRLPIESDGSIRLSARAWAVRGRMRS
jgi:SAM-dependent methyltransferase